MLVYKTRLNLVYFVSDVFKCLSGISYCFYSKKSFKMEKKECNTFWCVTLPAYEKVIMKGKD